MLVIDEAGMLASRQLARFVREAEARGAKLVLVGDLLRIAGGSLLGSIGNLVHPRLPQSGVN